MVIRRRFVQALVCGAILALPVPMNSQSTSLSADEHRMLQHVDAHVDSALKLLEAAVNINSGTQNFAGVRSVGKLFAAEFEALGVKTRWVDGAKFNRAGHLVA